MIDGGPRLIQRRAELLLSVALPSSIELAVGDVNEAGGLLDGQEIELVVEDDASSLEGQEAAARALLSAEVAVIVHASGLAIVGPVADAVGSLVVVSGTGSAVQAGLSSPHLFRPVPDDALEGTAIAMVATGRQSRGDLDVSCERLAVGDVGNAYGQPLHAVVMWQVNERGGTVVVDVAHPMGDTSEVLEPLAAASPGCIALLTYGSAAMAVVEAWHSGGGGEVTWLGSHAATSAEVARAAHEAGDLFLGVRPDVDPESPSLRRFLEACEARFGAPPADLGGFAFDAAALLLLGIEEAGAIDGEAVRGGLLSVGRFEIGDESYGPGELGLALSAMRGGAGINYDGAGGAMELFDDGNVITDYGVWAWDGSSLASIAEVDADEILDLLQS